MMTMKTYDTLESARNSLEIDSEGRHPIAKVGDKVIQYILQVELETGDTAYTRSLISADQMRDVMRTSGRSIGIKRIVAEHAPIPCPAALRGPAETAYDEVIEAERAVERAEEDGQYDPGRIIRARQRAEQVRAQWEADFPEDAQAKQERAQRAAQQRMDEIRGGTGYRAALEGRD